MIEKPDSFCEIQKISYNLLKESKSWGVLPTPVDKLVTYSELAIDNKIDLSKAPTNFISKHVNILKNALTKILGALDIREKTIYLDLSQNEKRKRFVKLHEVGHNVLYWQNTILNLDDEYSLNPDCKILFENEANIFSSSTLFQLDLFEHESKKLPLQLTSAIRLANLFGSSVHASLRRYVEYSPKKCALLILEFSQKTKVLQIRNYFQSHAFTKEFGNLLWPKVFTQDYPFVTDVHIRRRLHENGIFFHKNLRFSYHFFNNSHNCFFVFIKPEKEFNRSRIKFAVKI